MIFRFLVPSFLTFFVLLVGHSPAEGAKKPKPATKPKISTQKPQKKTPPKGSGAQSIVGSYTQEDRDAMDAFFSLDVLTKRVKNTGVGAPVAEPNCTQPFAPNPASVSSQETAPPEETTPSRFKSIKEIGSYINCYLDEKDFKPDSSNAKRIKRNKEAYFKKYNSLIATAAAEFQIPENYLTCLLMRENQFDKSKVSSAGALGLAQIMPGTLTDISKHLKWGQQDESRLDIYKEQAANKDNAFSKKVQEEAQVRLMIHSNWVRWKSYFEKLRNQKKFKGAVPTKLNQTSAEIPEIAIATSAFYLRFIIDTFEADLNQKGTVKTATDKDPDFDFLVTIGGAYNLGHGGAARALEKVRPPSSKKWREKLAKDNAETRNHMESIANCLEKGSTKPPSGDRQKDCPQ